MQRVKNSFILIICFFVGLEAKLPQSVSRRNPVIHQKIEFYGSRENKKINAWIYFKDKGLDEKSFNNTLELVESKLSERTKWRRSKVMKNGIVTFKDIPVNQSYIAEVIALGVTLRRSINWMNAISVSATRDQIEKISKLHFVSKIDPVLIHKQQIPKQYDEIKSLPDSGVKSLHKKSVIDSTDYGNSWEQIKQIKCQLAHQAGFTGKGVIVLMLDTGYYKDHESFQKERIIAEWDFINNDGNTQNETNDPNGQHNHGTYTASALGGYKPGSLISPAYEAKFLLAKTEMYDKEIQQEEDNYVEALAWGESLGADVVSSSLGYLDWYTYYSLDGNTAVTTKAVDFYISRGMVCVTAAGNEGNDEWYYIIAPADADSVIAVGAVDSNGGIASFSSHGPTKDGRIKPEVCARGIATACASPYGVDSYYSVSGTSLSTPLVAGAAAVILSAHPDWTPMMVREALMMTASRTSTPDNTYGWGIIDVWAAINYSTITEDEIIPATFYLKQNYPNPFNAATVINYSIKSDSYMTLKVYNIIGAEVEILVDKYQTSQNYSFKWESGNLPSGIYFVQLQTDDFVQTRKMILLK